jgi:hypothetical protein
MRGGGVGRMGGVGVVAGCPVRGWRWRPCSPAWCCGGWSLWLGGGIGGRGCGAGRLAGVGEGGRAEGRLCAAARHQTAPSGARARRVTSEGNRHHAGERDDSGTNSGHGRPPMPGQHGAQPTVAAGPVTAGVPAAAVLMPAVARRSYGRRWMTSWRFSAAGTDAGCPVLPASARGHPGSPGAPPRQGLAHYGVGSA